MRRVPMLHRFILPHSHVWVSVHSDFPDTTNSSATGTRNSWTFADMFSAFVTMGLPKTNGTFTRKALQALAEVNIGSLPPRLRTSPVERFEFLAQSLPAWSRSAESSGQLRPIDFDNAFLETYHPRLLVDRQDGDDCFNIGTARLATRQFGDRDDDVVGEMQLLPHCCFEAIDGLGKPGPRRRARGLTKPFMTPLRVYRFAPRAELAAHSLSRRFRTLPNRRSPTRRQVNQPRQAHGDRNHF
jgi:hypothetical protein